MTLWVTGWFATALAAAEASTESSSVVGKGASELGATVSNVSNAEFKKFKIRWCRAATYLTVDHTVLCVLETGRSVGLLDRRDRRVVGVEAGHGCELCW